MNAGQWPGLTGNDDEGGRSQHTGPPRRARVGDVVEPGGIGLPEKKVAVNKPKGNGEMDRLWFVWTNDVAMACFGKSAQALPERPQFNAQVRKLMAEGELTAQAVEDMFIAFAGRVSAGTVSVEGKPAFGVFMRSWHKLRGRASDMGLGAAIEGKTLANPEDWTSL